VISRPPTRPFLIRYSKFSIKLLAAIFTLLFVFFHSIQVDPGSSIGHDLTPAEACYSLSQPIFEPGPAYTDAIKFNKILDLNMSASMLDRFPSPREEEQSQSPAAPSRKDEQNGSAPRHRKAASTGGGRAWTEEEVSNTQGLPYCMY
jgi:hypothetical protein